MNRRRRGPTWGDAGLVAVSIALVAVTFTMSAHRPLVATFSVTLSATTTAMYARLAMGRWLAAAGMLASSAALMLLAAPPRLVVLVLLCSVLAAEMAQRSTSRGGLLRTGLATALLAGAIALSGLAADVPLAWRQAIGEGIGAAAGGFLAAPTLLAYAPIAEWVFRHVTPLTLTEWLNYDHPLLRDLATRAPGTFQHSVSVGLLADAGARSVGANALLARVGGLYHDVGKIFAPGYFIENQSGDNPHDGLDPELSAEILRAHVGDGVRLVTAHHMGARVAEFVREHHGTGVMQLFHDKARQRDGAADEAAYRYPGPRPRSRETAIVMMADQLEATARSAPPADLDACLEMTTRTIDRIAASGQLADAPLRNGDLDRLAPAFARAVFAMYHRRLRYPQPEAASGGSIRVAGRWLGGRQGSA